MVEMQKQFIEHMVTNKTKGVVFQHPMIQKRRASTVTPLRKRRLKRKFKRFWKEWGITWEEFEVLLGAISIIMSPFLLRIFFAFFGI